MLSYEDDKYLKLAQINYSMSEASVRRRMYLEKKSFKEVYEKLVEEERIVRELQEAFCELDAEDAEYYFEGKHAKLYAKRFLIYLFIVDLDKPIQANAMGLYRKIYKKYHEENNK